jgi:hypothetical protein
MFKVTCLVAARKKLGLLKSLVLKVLEKRFQHNVTYREANICNQSIKYNQHVLYECTKKRGSDSENFGTRITGFGVGVEKIWNFEVSGLFLCIFLRLGTFLEKNFKFWGLTAKSWSAGRFSQMAGA